MIKSVSEQEVRGMGDLANYGQDKAQLKQVIGGVIAVVLVMAIGFFI